MKSCKKFLYSFALVAMGLTFSAAANHLTRPENAAWDCYVASPTHCCGLLARGVDSPEACVSAFHAIGGSTLNFLGEGHAWIFSGTYNYIVWWGSIYGEEVYALTRASSDQQYSIKLLPLTGASESSTILASVEPGSDVGLVARVFDQNNRFVPNANLRLEMNVATNSGGHLHHTNRLRGSLGGTSNAPHVITGNTDGAGLVFNFTAPEASGDHKITASCTDGKSCRLDGPDMLWVGIKGLIPLPANSDYVLLPNADTLHPDNHYMTSRSAAKIANLANLYHKQFPNSPLLRLNDASLARGGLFDIQARSGKPWTPPHKLHRHGIHIDIRANEFMNTDAIPHQNYFDFEELADRARCVADMHLSLPLFLAYRRSP